MLNVVLKDLSDLIRLGFPMNMSVDVSAADLDHSNFCNVVRDTLEKYNIPPKLLELEIKETNLLSNMKSTRSRLVSLC